MKDLKEKKERQMEGRKNNKGFSLVELIIVIAIMAILVGVVGTQVLPYMERSREAKDMQVLSAICTAAVSTFAENAGDVTSDTTFTYTKGTDATVPSNSKINDTLKEFLGVAKTDKLFDKYLMKDSASGTTASKLESKRGKAADKLEIKYVVATGEVTVSLPIASGSAITKLDSVTSK